MTAFQNCSAACSFNGTVRSLNPAELRAALRSKLGEEVAESLDSGEVLELADVLEVVYALAELDGVGELEELRAQKAEERGGFGARLWWEPPVI
ncbi:nucleoside triphosphate pyrophosphohydrolase [Deinococcus arenicola]|uniref:Nucleoside triphosphate pyrophosphohydrolase n=1 Tax=Deinococcus arenicola TaxID=2994950 RepID=A0ABU4DR82_9DEIO|nr:nucleoside triphosphate pyrophosphohydrolase [Deinococcus sp. ZS9-10]MDV6374935.1 nucleoside triphosphate pyrophosphohydrolase [Deinococcus sp. ZS9-10]